MFSRPKILHRGFSLALFALLLASGPIKVVQYAAFLAELAPATEPSGPIESLGEEEVAHRATRTSSASRRLALPLQVSVPSVFPSWNPGSHARANRRQSVATLSSRVSLPLRC